MSKKNEVGKPLAQFEMNLDSLLDKGVAGIPSDINSDMLKMNAMMSISQNESLMKVARDQPSVIAQYVFNFVVQGLDMLAGEAYIIPYKGKLTPVIDYKGQKKIAMQYSVKPIKIIRSGVVYEKDTFDFDENNHFTHKFNPFDTNRGKAIGAYSSIIYNDGSQQDTFVNMDEINKVRKASPSSSSSYSPWSTWSESMYEKTAIRKSMKYVNLNFKSTVVQQAYKESDSDVEFDNERKSKQETVKQDDAFDFVDAEFTENKETGEITEVVVDLD